jgi:hypothetical protein
MIQDESIIEYTISTGKANLMGFLLIIPILVFALLPFSIIWDYNTFDSAKRIVFENFIVILIVGVFVHELLHGITWAIFAKNGFKSIKFGMIWSWLTPYCHCKEPLKAKHYAVGGAMPLVIMGIFPIIISLISGNGLMLSIGILFTWAAGGDIISLYMLRRIDSNESVYDHPDKLGFYVMDDTKLINSIINKEGV